MRTSANSTKSSGRRSSSCVRSSSGTRLSVVSRAHLSHRRKNYSPPIDHLLSDVGGVRARKNGSQGLSERPSEGEPFSYEDVEQRAWGTCVRTLNKRPATWRTCEALVLGSRAKCGRRATNILLPCQHMVCGKHSENMREFWFGGGLRCPSDKYCKVQRRSNIFTSSDSSGK